MILPPAEDHLGRMRPLGWIWGGVLHLLSGVTLEEADGGMWTFTGQVVDSEGNVLREADWDPEWDYEL